MMDMEETPFQRWLADNDACREAKDFVGDMTPQEAWDACDQPKHHGWMMWLVGIAKLEDRFPMADCGCCRDYKHTVKDMRAVLPVLPDFLPQPTTSVAVEVTAGSERTIFHVIFPENTVTFLSEGKRDQFYDDNSTGVKCESTVTETVYGALIEMREDHAEIKHANE